MKNLPLFMQKNFVSRTSVVAFADKVFIIETSLDYLVVEPGSENYRYELYGEGKKIAKCYISNSFPDSNQKQIYHNAGFKEVPDHYIGLRNITCWFEEYDNLTKKREERDYRNNQYASILLNFVIGDVETYGRYIEKPIPILLDREDKVETLAFYSKFTAKYNYNQNKVQGFTPMIINNPMQVDNYTGKVINEEYVLRITN